MNKKRLLIIGLGALALWVVWEYYKSLSGGSGSPTGALGTNLNSVAPELIGGSTGPNSGLNYYGGSTVLNITENSSSAVPPSTTITPPKVIPVTQTVQTKGVGV